jgi:hypothetical protein
MQNNMQNMTRNMTKICRIVMGDRSIFCIFEIGVVYAELEYYKKNVKQYAEYDKKNDKNM